MTNVCLQWMSRSTRLGFFVDTQEKSIAMFNLGHFQSLYYFLFLYKNSNVWSYLVPLTAYMGSPELDLATLVAVLIQANPAAGLLNIS